MVCLLRLNRRFVCVLPILLAGCITDFTHYKEVKTQAVRKVSAKGPGERIHVHRTWNLMDDLHQPLVVFDNEKLQGVVAMTDVLTYAVKPGRHLVEVKYGPLRSCNSWDDECIERKDDPFALAGYRHMDPPALTVRIKPGKAACFITRTGFFATQGILRQVPCSELPLDE